MFEMFGWILIALGLIIIGRVLMMKEARKMEYDDLTSKVYSAMSTEQGFKLYDLTQQMKLQADQILDRKPEPIGSGWVEADGLAKTVLEFLKVSGWSGS